MHRPGMRLRKNDPTGAYWYDTDGVSPASPVLSDGYSTISASDIGTGTSTNVATRQYARMLGRGNDDAGHIRSSLHGGSGTSFINIFPQSLRINRGAFRVFERGIADDALANKHVTTVVMRIFRPGPPFIGINTTRPAEIRYMKIVNGRSTTRTFPNP